MYFDEFKHQLPDIDPAETEDWMTSLDQVVEQEGETRARFLVYKLLKRARQLQIGLPPLTQTRYINTISPEQEPAFPGDEAMELRIRRIVRWNAVAMVLRANNRFPGIGGHLSTYASSASLYEVGFNHFFRGKDDGAAGDQIFYQGHAAPGIYARAFLEGRLSEDQLDHFRREGKPGEGLSSYPHPRLMPDFWEFPTVSMGLGPISAIYQARFNRYLQNRGLLDTSRSRVWAFLGDGETDEPESLGALHVAAREGLDNLTFVVNCNLQRLDGPVRGNGKIIQELEAVFRGSGWNVIKVIWAREWDELLARDVDGVLVQQMNDTLDGEFQKFSVAGGGVHPRALLRPGPAAAQARRAPLRRRPCQAPPRRPRLPEALRRLQGRDRVQGRPDGHPRQDREGLDARSGRRGAQHHPPGQEAVREGADGLPRSTPAADPGREAQGRAVLPPRARSRRRSSTCASDARRSAARSPSGSSARSRCRRQRPRSTPSSRAAARRRSRPRWCSPGSCGT